MIPSTAGFLNQDFEVEEKPSKVYRMDIQGESIRGFTDKKEAMEQAIFRILSTERYQNIIYPWWYGIETLDLFGQPVTWVCPELERRIEEALTVDDRINSVTDFEHDISRKGIVSTSFTVHTVYGDLKEEYEVKI